MTQYMIHTCNSRIWYVEQFLVPALKEQGIKNVIVYNDTNNEGQLRSLLKSYDLTNDKDTWHLQDDIVISKHFRKTAESYTEGIACGFCNSFSKGRPGFVELNSMWYSMPCIRIPGDIFRYFINWLYNPVTQRKFKHYFAENKHDDVLLELFLKEQFPHMQVYNIAPNMVNHIDHLLGGSLINKDRNKEPSELMATYWEEPDVLQDIAVKLQERRKA